MVSVIQQDYRCHRKSDQLKCILLTPARTQRTTTIAREALRLSDGAKIYNVSKIKLTHALTHIVSTQL